MGNYQDAHVQGCVDSVKCQNAHILFYLGFPNSPIAASLPNYQSEPKLTWKKSKRRPITISSQLNWSNLGHKHGSLADTSRLQILVCSAQESIANGTKQLLMQIHGRKEKLGVKPSNSMPQVTKEPGQKSGKINICTIGN